MGEEEAGLDVEGSMRCASLKCSAIGLFPGPPAGTFLSHKVSPAAVCSGGAEPNCLLLRALPSWHNPAPKSIQKKINSSRVSGLLSTGSHSCRVGLYHACFVIRIGLAVP